MLLDLNPVVYLSAFTGLAVGYFVWRGSGSWLKAIFAAPMTWAFLLVLPVIALAFLAHLAGYPRAEWRTAWGSEWAVFFMFAFNAAVWVWMAWQCARPSETFQ